MRPTSPRRLAALLTALVLGGLTACSSPASAPSGGSSPSGDDRRIEARLQQAPTHAQKQAAAQEQSARPRYDHVVVVVFENKARSQVLDHARYLRRLGNRGAEMTRSFAVTHPSQPNYIDLFSGGPHGVVDDSCPHLLRGRHLASQLTANGYTFAAWSEGLPAVGSKACSAGRYARKHAPWVNFKSFEQRQHKPFGRFPDDFTKLPTVSFVIPDLCHDMHDCSVATGSRWAKRNLGDYAAWARTHHSLLVVTFDEDDHTARNHIYTALVGAGIDPGNYRQRIDHYNLLRTLENLYGLPALGKAADRRQIRGIWK